MPNLKRVIKEIGERRKILLSLEGLKLGDVDKEFTPPTLVL